MLKPYADKQRFDIVLQRVVSETSKLFSESQEQ